jgi:ribosomal protein S18 acetylase RimI-like enzyme
MCFITWPRRRCFWHVLSFWIGVATLWGWQSSCSSLFVHSWTAAPLNRHDHHVVPVDPNDPSPRYSNDPFSASSSSSPYLHTDTCVVPIESPPSRSVSKISARTLLATPGNAVQQQQQQLPIGGDYSIRIVSECNNDLLERVAEFLVNAYWLGTPRVWVNGAFDVTTVPQRGGLPYYDNPSHRWSGERLQLLIRQQAADLAAKFSGQSRRMAPQSWLQSTLLMATTNTNQHHYAATSGHATLVGVVCVQELLLDRDRGVLLSVEESHQVLRQIWGSLPRLTQRHHASSSATRLWPSLVSTRSPYASLVPVSVLCNLAVAPSMRRRGVARALCVAAYNVARHRLYSATRSGNEQQRLSTAFSTSFVLPRSPNSTGPFPPPPQLMLKVERDNASALALYKALGYQPYSRISNDPALRLDAVQGILVPVQVESYLLQLQ